MTGVELATLTVMGRVRRALVAGSFSFSFSFSLRVVSLVGLVGMATLSVGCGGSVHDDLPSPPNGAQTKLAGPGIVPNSPYGNWELVSLKGEKRKPDTEVHNHFYMELRSDGKAIARRCTKAYYEPGSVLIRCADSQAYDCTYGTLKEEDGIWRVEFPDLEPVRADDRGEVDVMPNGSLVVRHLLPSYASGEFVRLNESSQTSSCIGSSSP